MATVKDITTMCKAGQVQQAYDLAKADMEQQLPWAQREKGWALYYLIKGDSEAGNYPSLVEHLDELKSLDQLSLPNDKMIFECVLFKVAMLLKDHVAPSVLDTPAKLSTIFSKLCGYNFEASKGYSFLLQTFIKYDGWQEMADFLDWWNLDKLTQEDYTPFQLENGRTIMSLAERAYIAKSKALLRIGDRGRIEEFLPQLDNLMTNHPEMTYPGYFYGKLLLALGSTPEDELKVIIPFARKKTTEFWVWQLLAEVFVDDQEKQLACLLRATHCHTQEKFLGKVRIRLAALYIKTRQYDHAKYQINKVMECYLSQGWRIPYQIDQWIHESWINTAKSEGKTTIDFIPITDQLLCVDAEEAVAVVTYTDPKTHRSTLVYGMEKRMSQKLRFKVGQGTILKIHYVNQTDGKPRILSTQRTELPDNLDFVKTEEGIIVKREDVDFAFLKVNRQHFFIAPGLVRKNSLQNHDAATALVVWDYNKKKDTWNWTCVNVNKSAE